MKMILGAATAAFTLMFASAMAQSDSPGKAGDPVAQNISAGPASDAAKTEIALACILGMGPGGCDASFHGGALPVFQRVAWRGGPNPFFSSAQFVERNGAGDDVWNVKIRGTTYTYIIAPPDADGVTSRLFVLSGPPNRMCDNQIEQAVEHNGRIWTACSALFSSATH